MPSLLALRRSDLITGPLLFSQLHKLRLRAAEPPSPLRRRNRSSLYLTTRKTRLRRYLIRLRRHLTNNDSAVTFFTPPSARIAAAYSTSLHLTNNDSERA